MTSPLLTVGHGTLEQRTFLDLLLSAGVARLVDVRRFPGSRRHPHFGTEPMASWLTAGGIDYRWEPRLGGRRRVPQGERLHEEPAADPWWQVEAFRAYAAHTRTAEFVDALTGVLASGTPASGSTAILCSESVWWRCHRRLIADVAVLLHDVPVLHLAHSGRLAAHPPAAGARVTPEGLRYDRTG